MVEVACQCAEGFGLPHTHVPAQIVVKRRDREESFRVPYDVWNLNIDQASRFELVGREPESIRMWVDRKSVV